MLIKATALAVLLPCGQVAAQTAPCVPDSAMTAHLRDKYDEYRSWMGVQNEARIIQLYTADDGTWTIVATTAGKMSCILASGQNWRAFEPPKPGEPG